MYETVELPEPNAGEVRLRQTVIGVNFIDTYHRSGLYPMKTPFTPGSEAAGVVEAVGADVKDIAVGDRVVYAGGPIGSYTHHRNYPAERLVKIPSGISDEVAAAGFLKGLTAQYLLRSTFEVKPGHVVLVMAAAGGVGSLLVQWARHLGATVIATVGSTEKVAVAESCGAHHVIQYRATPDYAARVREITGGRGVDVVYDGVGKATFERSLDCLRPRGLMVSYGNASGAVEQFNLGMLAAKGSLFVTRPVLNAYTATREELMTRVDDLFAAIEGGVVRVAVGGRYPLAEARRAHEDLESRNTTAALLLIP